jgi:hypothetical protein
MPSLRLVLSPLSGSLVESWKYAESISDAQPPSTVTGGVMKKMLSQLAVPSPRAGSLAESRRHAESISSIQPLSRATSGVTKTR